MSSIKPNICACDHEWGEHYQRYDGQHGCSAIDYDYDQDCACSCERFVAKESIRWPQYGRTSSQKVHVTFGPLRWTSYCGSYIDGTTPVPPPDADWCKRCQRKMESVNA